MRFGQGGKQRERKREMERKLLSALFPFPFLLTTFHFWRTFPPLPSLPSPSFFSYFPVLQLPPTSLERLFLFVVGQKQDLVGDEMRWYKMFRKNTSSGTLSKAQSPVDFVYGQRREGKCRWEKDKFFLRRWKGGRGERREKSGGKRFLLFLQT